MPTDPGVLRERAVQASARGRPALAVRLLGQALSAVDGEGDDDLRVRLLVSLAHATAETGHVAAGLAHLDEARRLLEGAPRTTRGLWHGQRGLLLLRAGRHLEADDELGVADRLLVAEPSERARVLLNRGVMHLRRAALQEASSDFRRCREIAASAGLRLLAAKAVANDGYVAYLRGDLPGALEAMDAADVDLQELAPGARAVNVKDRAETLAAAALLDEADQELRKAVRLLRGAGLRQDMAEAELSLAHVALRQGRRSEARSWARRAAGHFEERGATGWRLLAELLLAQVDATRRPDEVDCAAADLEPALRTHGLVEEAAVARLVRVAALVAASRTEEARRVTAGRRWTPEGATVGTRLLAHETRALLHAASGDVAAAQRVRRHGLSELTAYQSRFGSIDLVTSASAIGRRLATDGLTEALRDGRASTVLRWSELTRATSSRIQSVRPPVDDEHAASLAMLRHLRSQERAARLAGRPPSPAARAEARALEALVRRRAWRLPGTLRAERPVGLGELRSALGGDGTLVSLMAVGPSVYALAVTARTARVSLVGSVTGIRESVLRLRADLDVLATHLLPAPLRVTVESSLRRGLGRLASLLTEATTGLGPAGPVVIVPSGLTALVPWPLLPPLHGRPVCVVPSATWWVLARKRPDGPTAREVLVAGPDVVRAEAEVRSCAQGARDPVVLTGPEATTGATLRAADGASVLHVAAHGRHEPDNPLFSCVLLADGWLFGHDLDAVPTLPRHVVLSACETGMSSIRAGDEALGLTAALLHGGTRSVVASVARVGDAVAERVAVAHHRGLRSGTGPAASLAASLELADHAAPTVCFGAGW